MIVCAIGLFVYVSCIDADGWWLTHLVVRCWVAFCGVWFPVLALCSRGVVYYCF